MKVNIGPYTDDRKVEIEVDDYDIWNLDHTMALMLLPLVKYYRNFTNGTFSVDDDDLPEDLKHTPQYSEDRNNYVLDAIIWSFEQIVENNDGTQVLVDGGSMNEAHVHEVQINNGLRLFGKYFRSLWT